MDTGRPCIVILMSNADTATAPRTWTPARGGYGRSAKALHNAAFRTVAIMVTLPKCYFDEYGKRYMVTDLRAGIAQSDRLESAEFAKRADAVAYAEATFPA